MNKDTLDFFFWIVTLLNANKSKNIELMKGNMQS